MNDRQLRAHCGRPGRHARTACPREDGFDITVGQRGHGGVLPGQRPARTSRRGWAASWWRYTYDGRARHRARPQGARARWPRCCKDALKPNLVQTLEGTPALDARRPLRQHRPRLQLRHRHAHGAEAGATTVVTEAGFGADLGAEKFLDIKCRMAGLRPERRGDRGDGARAQDTTAACPRPSWTTRIWRRWKRASPTCCSHVENMHEAYSACPCVVALNALPDATRRRSSTLVAEQLRGAGRERARCSEVWAKGGEGGLALAEEVRAPVRAAHATSTYAYELDEHRWRTRSRRSAKQRLPRRRASASPPAPRSSWRELDELGFGNLPGVHGQDAVLLLRRRLKPAGRAGGLHHHRARAAPERGRGLRGGAHGRASSTMPGLPKVPAAEGIDVDENGEIVGLF